MTPEEKRLEVALQTRAFEIELFWKRSIFFWGFISVAFAGYGAFRAAHSDLAIVVACFGLVCSTAWTLLNRGSKYWQEAWEQKVERYEYVITGRVFSVQEPVEAKGLWLQARRYSVSKLLIALSDYVLFIWAVLVLGEDYEFAAHFTLSVKDVAIAAFGFVSVVYAALLLVYGKTTMPSDTANGSEPETDDEDS